jgi:hypothetical protein
MKPDSSLDHYLREFAKRMLDNDYFIKRALVNREITVNYVVEQLRIGLKEALGTWIVQEWEKNNETQG